jgi:drug/metabolite transporter (DMT)-like permease
LLTTLSWTLGIFPFTEAARRIGSHSLNQFRLLLAMSFIAITGFIFYHEAFIAIFSSQYSKAWLWLGISGIVGLTIGDFFAFEMFKILGARTGSVLTTFAPAAALITGGLLINERISVIGIFGIMLTILGVNFVSFGKREREKIPDLGHGSTAYGIITGILAALCQGAGLVLAKKGLIEQGTLHQLEPIPANFIRLSCAAGSLLLFWLSRGKLKEIFLPVIENRNNGLKFAVGGTFFGPTMGVSLSLYTITLLDPSVAQTIFSLVPAFAFLLSAAFYKDKITFQSILGLAIAISGVMILIWRAELQNMFY